MPTLYSYGIYRRDQAEDIDIHAMLPALTLQQLARLMTLAEKTFALGEKRKEFVLKELKLLLGAEEFARKEPFINLAIEAIIMISRAEIDIKKINPKSWCCCK